MGAVDIRVYLLGNPRVVIGGENIRVPSRYFLLLAMLVLNPARRMSRNQIASRLFPDQLAETAQANLRQLLLRVRQAFNGASAGIDVSAETVALNLSDTETDLGRLAATTSVVSWADLKTLLSLYAGDLVSDGPASRFADDILTIERSAIRSHCMGLASHALQELSRKGTVLIDVLREIEIRLVDANVEDEQLALALIGAYKRSGNLSDAERLRKQFGLDGNASVSARQTQRGESSLISAERGTLMLPRLAILAPTQLGHSASVKFLLRSFVEDVANELSRYRTFVALAAHSAFQAVHDGGVVFDNANLRADYTVSCFLRPGKGLGLLCLRLVSTSTQAILWSGEYELSKDRLAISFRFLVARLAATLAGEVERNEFTGDRRVGSSAAYIHFLMAENTYKTCTFSAIRRARKFYQAAVAEANEFAPAHSGVANMLCMEWLMLGGNDPELLIQSRRAAEKAIEIDPNSAYGHWRKAVVGVYQHRFDESEQLFQTAQDLHPNHADILLDQSDALGHIGDPKIAQKLFDRAIDLNPMPPEHYWWVGAGIAFSNGKYGSAIDLCKRLSNDESVLRLLTASHGQLRNTSEAKYYCSRLKENYPGETAEQMALMQPHRDRQSIEPFIEGLRIAGLK